MCIIFLTQAKEASVYFQRQLVFVGVLVDALVGQGSGKFKGLAVCLKQYFDFPARWMNFQCLAVCVRQVFCLRNVFFALLLCYSFVILFDSLNLWVDFACVILISSNGNICYSLFTLIVTFYFCFVLRYVYLVCFLFYFNLKTLCLQSRMLISYKWLKMKKMKVVICIVLLFILLSSCVCVLFTIG